MTASVGRLILGSRESLSPLRVLARRRTAYRQLENNSFWFFLENFGILGFLEFLCFCFFGILGILKFLEFLVFLEYLEFLVVFSSNELFLKRIVFELSVI